jgi:hypothetical protein
VQHDNVVEMVGMSRRLPSEAERRADREALREVGDHVAFNHPGVLSDDNNQAAAVEIIASIA